MELLCHSEDNGKKNLLATTELPSKKQRLNLEFRQRHFCPSGFTFDRL